MSDVLQWAWLILLIAGLLFGIGFFSKWWTKETIQPYREHIESTTPNPKETSADTQVYSEATHLNIDRLYGILNVEVYNGRGFEVTRSGPREHVEKIACEINGSCLAVTDRFKGVTSNGSVNVSGNGVSIICDSGSSVSNVTVNGVKISGIEPVIVTVKVPRKTPLNITGLFGNAVIGNTEGTLRMVLTGSSDITCGKVGKTCVDLTGSGEVEIAEVSESLTVKIMGSKDVRVRGGKIQDLEVDVMGSGDFRFDGEAQNADLKVMGSGDIRVAKVVNKVTKNKMGSGRIKVG